MIKNNNNLVYEELTMSVYQETLFNIIEFLNTEYYKRGHASNAWKKYVEDLKRKMNYIIKIYLEQC